MEYNMTVCEICGKMIDIVLKTSEDDWWSEAYHLKCVQEKEAWMLKQIYNIEIYKKEKGDF